MRQQDPIIPDRPTVSFQPAVFIALADLYVNTDLEADDFLVMAVLINLLWENQDEQCETIMSLHEMERRTGLGEFKQVIPWLTHEGILSRRRADGYDSPYAYTVHPEFILKLVES